VAGGALQEILSALEENQKRLRELVGSEVDGAILPSGYTDLLARSQESLSHQTKLLRSVLNAYPANVALLGVDGEIVEVNQAWIQYSRENGIAKNFEFGGRNYLDYALDDVRAGLKGVLKGSAGTFSTEYPCHSPEKQRWYRMIALPLDPGAVVLHVDVTDHFLAAEALQRSEEHYRTLFQCHPHPVWVVDEEGGFLDVNQTAVEVYGYSRDEFLNLGESDLQIAPTEFEKERGLERHRCKDGRILSVRADSHLVEYTNWRGRLVVAVDMTHKVQAELELQRSQALLSVASELSRLAAWAVDLPENSLELSDQYRVLLQLPARKTITLEEAFNQVHPDDLPELRAKFDACCQVGGTYHHEFRAVVDDQTYWVRVAAEALTDSDSKVVRRVQGALQDISSQRENERRLADQATLIEQARDGILVFGTDSRVLFWSQGATVLYGWSVEEALGAKAETLCGSEDTWGERLLNDLREKKLDTAEIEVCNRDGDPITVFARWTLLRDAFGQKEAVLAIHTDVTETKNLTEQLRRAQRMESLGTLAGGIAHDLNNILAPIVMASELLREEPGDQELIRSLQTNARRGADLVRQILNFARGAGGVKQSVDVSDVVQDIVRLTRETFPKSIWLETHVDPRLSCVTGDPTQIHQMLLNLCVNARDAMAEGGALTISAHNVDREQSPLSPEAGDCLRVSVRDTGCGIPSAVLEKIFEPFFTTKEPGKGTGLGLSTVFSIVRELGGQIDVASQIGKGTTFTIHLPARAEEGPQSVRPSQEASRPSGRGQTILLVDDETSIRRLGERVLRKAGYQVLTAANGAEALEIYKRERDHVKLVITDMSMPEMGGAALAKALRNLKPDLPVIGASGRGAQELEGDVRFTEFISKPFEIATLLSAVDRVCLATLVQENDHGT
jgi:PAS domain S-box-containing protein